MGAMDCPWLPFSSCYAQSIPVEQLEKMVEEFGKTIVLVDN
jgi:hypothetical protein